jgi:hypothetical protein
MCLIEIRLEQRGRAEAQRRDGLPAVLIKITGLVGKADTADIKPLHPNALPGLGLIRIDAIWTKAR